MPTEKELLAAARRGRQKAGPTADDVRAFVHMFKECWPLVMAPVVGPPGRDGRDGRDGKDGENGRDGERGARGPAGPPGSGGRIDPGVTGVAIVIPENDDPRVEAFTAEAKALALRELLEEDEAV